MTGLPITTNIDTRIVKTLLPKILPIVIDPTPIVALINVLKEHPSRTEIMHFVINFSGNKGKKLYSFKWLTNYILGVNFPFKTVH